MDFYLDIQKSGWNIHPKSKYIIPSSSNSLINAARAIAVCAYPDTRDHGYGSKAEKYSIALLANIARISRDVGHSKALPSWAKSMRVESMRRHLSTGYRYLMRSLTIRDLIHSAEIMKNQHEQRIRGEISTFTVQYSPNLEKITIGIPVEEVVSGYILTGRVPDTKQASLRSAIIYHQPALKLFQGPAIKLDGRDSEFDYQNLYNRHVRPALFIQHILQVVWMQINEAHEQAVERGIPIDELLMRQPEWAESIYTKSNEGLGFAILRMRHLGVPTCWCEMVRFAEPLPNS